mgnify:CR=1 FL=1
MSQAPPPPPSHYSAVTVVLAQSLQSLTCMHRVHSVCAAQLYRHCSPFPAAAIGIQLSALRHCASMVSPHQRIPLHHDCKASIQATPIHACTQLEALQHVCVS